MGTVNSGLFSSTTDEWPTPQELWVELNSEFDFTLDACATTDNAKCAAFYSPEDDGLTQPWMGTVWMNPPYGRGIAQWIKKAYESALEGATVVCLIPCRTDTAYWHDYVMKADEIRLIRGRLHFDCDRQRAKDSKAHNAPFPSAVVVFRRFNTPKIVAIDRTGRTLS